MVPKRDLARLLHRLADFVERATDEDYESFLAGKGRPLTEKRKGVSRTSDTAQNERKGRTALSKDDIRSIVDELKSLRSREEGLSLIEGRELIRRDLELIARSMDLPVL